MAQLQRGVSDMAVQMEHRLKTSSMESEQKLENIRSTMEKKLGAIQADNNTRLDEMRRIVDEKLQKTLDERMTQSFQLVNERLEQVYKGHMNFSRLTSFTERGIKKLLKSGPSV